MSQELFFILGDDCECPEGYTQDENTCTLEETIPADVTQSNFCLAPSQLADYSEFFTRVYKSGFSNTSIALFSAPTDTEIELNTNSQWKNPTNNLFSSSAVDLVNSQITITGHNLPNNTKVTYLFNMSTAIGGIFFGGTYYIIVIDTDTIQVSQTSGGLPIEYSSEGTGSDHRFVPVIGPMNRCGVWVDTDCDGDKDALANGVKTTISHMFNNEGIERTVYVGMGADNIFELVVNGVSIAKTLTTSSAQNFKIWHIFPVTLKTGINYFNAIATGDGSVNDSIGITIYDNTIQELTDAITDEDLNILFKSSSLIGEQIDIATCPIGYDLDTTEGQGNYICRRTLTQECE